jgi:hypothetical protein
VWVSPEQPQQMAAENQRVRQELQSGSSPSSPPADDPTSFSSAPPSLRRREDAPRGPRHTINGTIRHVDGSDPAVMDFDLMANAKVLAMRSGDYFKIQFMAIDFTPTSERKSCEQLDRSTAPVEFIEAADAVKDWVVAAAWK